MSMRSAAPASTTIAGSADFSAAESKTLTIDDVQYVITNKNLTDNSSISWSKDTTTGALTFYSENFIIEGQSDVAHNLIIKGSNNIIWGGELNDTLQDADTTSGQNTYCGEGAMTF